MWVHLPGAGRDGDGGAPQQVESPVLLHVVPRPEVVQHDVGASVRPQLGPAPCQIAGERSVHVCGLSLAGGEKEDKV